METKEDGDAKIDQFIDGYPLPIKEALGIAFSYGQIDGSHHKAWVIDQMVRSLVGSKFYNEAITLYKSGEDGPYTYEWDEGIAP